MRFPHFKPAGAAGGRVFFVSLAEAELPAYVERLERRCVLVEPPVRVSGPVSPEAFLAGMEAAS